LVLDSAAAYVRIVASAMILNYFLIVINAVLRGAGDTKTPMRITALVNVINIVGNAIFIYGLGPFQRWVWPERPCPQPLPRPVEGFWLCECF